MELGTILSASGNPYAQRKEEARVALKSREELLFSDMRGRTEVEQISDVATNQTVIEPKQYVITRHWKDPEGNHWLLCAELSTPLHHNRAHHFFGRLRVSGSGRRQHSATMNNDTYNKWVTACLGPTQCCPRKSVLERTCWRLTQEKETLNELLTRSTLCHVGYGVFSWSGEHMKGHVLLLCALWFNGSSVEAS